MSAHSKVQNLTDGCKIRRSQAALRVERCFSDWVEFGVSIRDLSIMEALERRAVHVKLEDLSPDERAKRKKLLALPFAELPGCVYKPNEQGIAGARKERVLALSANEFYRLAAQA